MFDVYGKESCSYCTLAKSLLENKGISYRYFDIEKDDVDLDHLINNIAKGVRTVPVVLRDGVYIGGYTELRNFIKNED